MNDLCYEFRSVERRPVECELLWSGPFDCGHAWRARLVAETFRSVGGEWIGYEIDVAPQRPRRVSVTNACTKMQAQHWVLANPELLLVPAGRRDHSYACYRVITAKLAKKPRPLFVAIPIGREPPLVLYDAGGGTMIGLSSEIILVTPTAQTHH